ncbi:MAG TPA: glycosyltransferase family 4 protein [Egibacteraceae bacterium]|nr:glycosyltransferase family 4 protein [Egibacteraceae bacterium]
MRIALVCPYDWSRPGGVQGHIASLGAYLAADHEVRVFAPGADRSLAARRALALQRPPVRLVGRPLPLPYNRSVAPVSLSPLSARRVVRELREFAPHVVHVHEPFAPLVSAAAAAFGPRPIVGTFHAWSSSNRAYRAIAPVARRVAVRLDARVAVSPAAQEFAAGALGLPMGAIRVIPNGVDVAAYASAAPIPELVDPQRPLLLFVGRLEPRKGLDVAVRAFLRLRSSHPGVRMCVVGEGAERERCQQMIPTALRPDVLFVGRVDEAEKPRYHASADLYLAPNSGGESFGVVLLEAMAAGLPVVASDISGYRTVLRDGRQGRLVAPGDAFAVAAAAATLLDNPRLRKAMAEEGRRTAAEYDWAVVGARVAELYRAVRRARGSST